MKTKTNFFSSVKKISTTALIVLIATTAIGNADFATVKSKIQNMIAADSGDFGYIITNVFNATTGRINGEYLDPTSPVWSNNGNDINYNLGKVGIGTTTPGSQLQVTKDQNALTYFDITNVDTGTSAGAIMRLITQKADNSSSTSVDMVKYKTGLFKMINNEPTGRFALGTNGTERLSIASDGDVGIGIADANFSKMEVYSNGATDGGDVAYYSLHRGGYTAWQLGLQNSDFVIAKGGGSGQSTLLDDKYLTIAATTGNVGMGNLKINNKVGTNEHTGITLGSSPDGGGTGSAELNFVGNGTSGDGAYIDYSVNNGRDLKFRTIETDVNGNESGHATIMTLHDTGNVTIAGSLNVSCVGNCF